MTTADSGACTVIGKMAGFLEYAPAYQISVIFESVRYDSSPSYVCSCSSGQRSWCTWALRCYSGKSRWCIPDLRQSMNSGDDAHHAAIGDEHELHGVLSAPSISSEQGQGPDRRSMCRPRRLFRVQPESHESPRCSVIADGSASHLVGLLRSRIPDTGKT